MSYSTNDSVHGILTQDTSGNWAVNTASGLSEQAAVTQATALMQNPLFSKVLVVTANYSFIAQATRTVSSSNVTSNPLTQ